MSGLIQKAHDMLLDAETPDDYLDAARALNMGTLLTMRLADDEKIRARLEAILDELIEIRKHIVRNTVQDKNIDSASGGGVPKKDDVTKQIWPANLDD
jgi:hypothetical protein